MKGKPMPTVEQIQYYVQQLPEPLQAEVLHYAEYLWLRSQQNGVSQERGHAMAAILDQLAALPDRSISDPTEWQQVERKDRDLPTR